MSNLSLRKRIKQENPQTTVKARHLFSSKKKQQGYCTLENNNFVYPRNQDCCIYLSNLFKLYVKQNVVFIQAIFIGHSGHFLAGIYLGHLRRFLVDKNLTLIFSCAHRSTFLVEH